MAVSEEGIEFYISEYDAFLDGELAQHSLTSRYAARRHVHLLKIAMALSASGRSTREITKEDIWKSIKILRGSEAKRNSIMRKIISEPIGDMCEHVMSLIIGAREISRADLIYEMRHRISHKELDVICEGFVESGRVKSFPKGGGK